MVQVWRGSLWVARCFGIRIGVHPSWLLIFALVVWALGDSFADLGRTGALALGIVTALAFFACVVIHELAHALVARRFGVATLSIRLFLFGGVATIGGEPPTPMAEAAIAAAGPLCSALLAVFFAAGLEALRLLSGVPQEAALLLLWLAVANAFLAVFNLLPAYPMDGGRILRALLWRLHGDRRAATRISVVVALCLTFALGAGGIVLAWTTHSWSALWYVALAGFVSAATIQSYRHARSEVAQEQRPAHQTNLVGGSPGVR